jgi:hypothetical protein
MFTFAVLAMLASSAPDASPAGTPAEPQVVVTGPHRPPAQRRVCRVVEQTSSRVGGTRVCHTQAEWEEARRGEQVDSQAMLSNLHDRLDQEAPRRPGPGGSPH